MKSMTSNFDRFLGETATKVPRRKFKTLELEYLRGILIFCGISAGLLVGIFIRLVFFNW